MFFKDDNTYHQMRRDSCMQWLDQLLAEEDVVNRSGAKVTKEYIQYLDSKIKELEDKNALKDEFLRKMKNKQNSMNQK